MTDLIRTRRMDRGIRHRRRADLVVAAPPGMRALTLQRVNGSLGLAAVANHWDVHGGRRLGLRHVLHSRLDCQSLSISIQHPSGSIGSQRPAAARQLSPGRHNLMRKCSPPFSTGSCGAATGSQPPSQSASRQVLLLTISLLLREAAEQLGREVISMWIC